MNLFALRRVIRARRLIEAALVVGILVAYLLVVTRGEIVETVAGSFPFVVAPAAPASTLDSTELGEQTQ